MSNNDIDDRQSASEGSNGPSLFLILLIVVAAITAVFIAQNRERVPVQFLFIEFDGRVWTTILIAVALGVLLDRLVSAWWRRARRRRRDVS